MVEKKSVEIWDNPNITYLNLFEVSKENFDKLPAGLRVAIVRPIVNGEPASMCFWGRENMFFNNVLDTEEIPEYFGEKAESSFQKYDDPLKWYEDYFDVKREYEDIYGIPKEPRDPVEEIEGLVINKVTETTVKLIRDHYGFEESSSDEEERVEDKPLFS